MLTLWRASAVRLCVSRENSITVHSNMVELENGQLPVPARAGRPTKFNDATLDRLCAALADGMSIKSACVVAGIGVTTLADWRGGNPETERPFAQSRGIAAPKN